MAEKIKTFAEMNKREKFGVIREAVSANEEYVAFLTREIGLLENKAASPRKPTATQVENERLKGEIVGYLTEVDTPKTIKELQEEIPCLSGLTNQRITHMLTDLVKSEIIARECVKKVPYFAIKR